MAGEGSVSSVVFKRKSIKLFTRYLNVREILPYSLTPGLDFLESEEQQKLSKLCRKETPRQQAFCLLSYLNSRKDPVRKNEDIRKFIACVNLASEHRGHREITKVIKRKLNEGEWKIIEEIERDNESPEPSPYTSPCRSPALIELEGTLAGEEFMKVEEKLWLAFSKGQYEELKCVIKIATDYYGTTDIDCQVVVLWFQALIQMHQEKDYPGAIQTLDSAMNLALNPECINRNILVGRIGQRKAQVYLMDKKKELSAREFEAARSELQFVGRGYDKANLFCREAKIRSVTEPDCRERIEEVYVKALSTLKQEDPYFIASYPSVTLSKTAFHLHIAFGSVPDKHDSLPLISSEDIEKAKSTLHGFNEDKYIFIEMRRLEYDLIQAELLRLDGKKEEAYSKFLSLTNSSSGNIAAIAQHRLKILITS